MFDVLTNTEVLQAEKEAIQNGLSEDILIENAASAVCENVLKKATKQTRILALCGGGKNGADGLSAARKLFLSGYNITVVMVSDKLCDYSAARLKACKALGVKIINNIDVSQFDFCDYDYIIDAMIGSGLKSDVSGAVKDIILKLAKRHIFTLSVDVASGLNSDSGMMMGECVVADETVTFCAVRVGHLLNNGRDVSGKLTVANIGIMSKGDKFIFSSEDAILPRRKIYSHKYNYGKVCIIAGCANYIGAAILASESAVAALKSGAGIVTLCVAESLKGAYQQRVKEATLAFMPDVDGYIVFDSHVLDGIMQKTNAIAIGMGMGANEDLPKIIKYLAQNFDGTLIIDADGLNALAKDLSVLCNHKAKIILTPHTGEFSRLIEGKIDKSESAINQVKTLAKLLNVVVAQKNATTIISDGLDTFINITGTPAMSKGGSGDVLAGMIAAFSCVLPPLKAACLACYNLGKAGELAEKKLGSEGVLASDIINNF